MGKISTPLPSYLANSGIDQFLVLVFNLCKVSEISSVKIEDTQ